MNSTTDSNPIFLAKKKQKLLYYVAYIFILKNIKLIINKERNKNSDGS